MHKHLLAALILLATTANAASLTVNPIRLELGAKQAATSMTIGNAADTPTTVQVSAYHWRHQDGSDQLEPATGADAPIITPPMFRLAPGGSQIVRIGFAGGGSSEDEGRWRLIVEEVPQPQMQAVPVALAPMQIATRLRVSMPLFRLPAVTRSALDWRLDRDGSTLVVANRGSTTERIDQAQLSAAGSTLARVTGPVYLFPGEARQYPLSMPAPSGTPARLNVQGSVPVDDHALALPAE